MQGCGRPGERSLRLRDDGVAGRAADAAWRSAGERCSNGGGAAQLGGGPAGATAAAISVSGVRPPLKKSLSLASQRRAI